MEVKLLFLFEIASLQSAVKVHGTLNHPADKDSGWTVEMAIPFRSIAFGNSWRAPDDGAIWRINFSRVQWDVEVKDGKYSKTKSAGGGYLPEHNWVWSPQNIINMHFPERWGYVQFIRNENTNKNFVLPYAEKQKQYLWLLYYSQDENFSKNGSYARTLKKMGWKRKRIAIDGRPNTMNMEGTKARFTAYITDGNGIWSINEQGHIKQVKIIP